MTSTSVSHHLAGSLLLKRDSPSVGSDETRNHNTATYAEVYPNVFVVAYVSASKNQCIIDLVKPSPTAAQAAGTVPRSEVVVPPTLRAAFPVPRVIQVLPEDEGIIRTVELVVDRQYKKPTAQQSTEQHRLMDSASTIVYAFIGTSNGTMVVCNAVRGTIITMAQFQYHHDFSSRGRATSTTGGVISADEPDLDGLSPPSSSSPLPDGAPRLRYGRSVPKVNQPIVRFAVQYKSGAFSWNPDMFMSFEVGSALDDAHSTSTAAAAVSGVYVVHKGGKIIYLGRNVLDTFGAVVVSNQDGQRPHFALDWPSTSRNVSSFPVAGPAADFASMVECVYTLDPVSGYSPNELKTHDANGTMGLDRDVMDAAFFFSTAHPQMDAPLRTNGLPTEAVVMCGRAPAFAVYFLESQRSQFSASRAVKVVTSLVKDMAKNLWWSAMGGATAPQETPKRLDVKPQQCQTSFLEADCVFSRVSIDPTQSYGAFYVEGSGRIYLVELSTGVVWRVLKGCRSAQFQWWLTTVSERKMLLLVVHLPLRHVVEVHSLRLRQRIAACSVPDRTQLLRSASPTGEGPPLLLTNTGEVRRLGLEVKEALIAEPTTSAEDQIASLKPHGVIDSGVLKSCRTPDDYFDVAMQLSIPLWTALDGLDSVSKSFDRFRRYKRQLASICEGLKRRYAPGYSDIRTIPLASHAVPRGLTASQCLNYLQLQSSVVDKYARLAQLFTVSRQAADEPAASRPPSKLAASSSVPEALWNSSSLLCKEATGRRYWTDAVQATCALLESTSHSREVPLLRRNWFGAHHQRVKPLAEGKPAPLLDANESIVDVYTFLSWFFCGGSKIMFRRDLVLQTEDAANTDAMGELAALCFKYAGLNAFETHLGILSELGFDMTDLACITLTWIANECAQSYESFVSSTSLGMLVFVLQSFTDESFLYGMSRARIQFANRLPDSLVVHDGMKGAVAGLLLCCVARQYSKPCTSSSNGSLAAMVAQLLHLHAAAAATVAASSAVSATPDGADDVVKCTTISLRLQYLLPNSNDLYSDTLEAYLQRLAIPTKQLVAFSQCIRQFSSTADTGKQAGAADGGFSFTALTDVLYACSVEVRMGQQKPVDCFHAYAWVDGQMWREEEFQALVINPIVSCWASVSSDPVTKAATTGERARRSLHQCCVLLTAVAALQETIKPFVGAPLPFWASETLPDICALLQRPWLSGSRSHRAFLSSVALLAHLTSTIVESVAANHADESRRVVLIQAISTCLATDDEKVFPSIPACFRRLLRMFMQSLVQYPLAIPHRTREVHSFASLLLFLVDIDLVLVDGKPLHRVDRWKLPWRDLFGNLSEQFVLFPSSGNEAITEMLPVVSVFGEGDDRCYRTKLRKGTTMMREFLSKCIVSPSMKPDDVHTVLLHGDTRATLTKLGESLGISREVPDVPVLIILDFHVKQLHPTEAIESVALTVGDKGMLACLAALNFRALAGSCVKYMSSISRSRARGPEHTQGNVAAEQLQRLVNIMSEPCRRWIHTQGKADKEVVAPSSLRLEVMHTSVWMLSEEYGLLDVNVTARAAAPKGNPQRTNFFELLFLLSQWAADGRTALPPDARQIAQELPALADAMRGLL